MRDGLDSLRSSPLLRWLGAMSTRNAMLVLVAATLLGIVFTLFAASEPGSMLGLFITVGSVAAALGIRRGSVYLVFPLPAIAFFVAAVITGKVKDSSLTSSTAGLGAAFLQWTADIFFPMAIATILVLIVGGVRWLLSRQLVTGQFPMSADRQGLPRPAYTPAPAPGPRRPASATPRTDQPPTDVSGPWPGQDRQDRPGTGPRPGSDGGRPDRMPREPRTDRDPGGDPRQSAAEPRPRNSRDGRPATPAQPRDRAPRPPARDPWTPGPQQPAQPQRPPRPQAPRGPWDQR